MKKLIFILLFTTALLPVSFAEDNDSEFLGTDDLIVSTDTGLENTKPDFKTNEIYATIGTPSLGGFVVGIFSMFFQVPVMVLKGEDNISLPKNTCPPITVGYNHFFLNNHLGLGVFGSYESMLVEFFTAQLKIIGQYGWKYFKFYHSLSIGAVIFPRINGVLPFMDLTLLGLKLDLKYFNIFLEASLPTTAMVKIGASVKF